MPKQTATLDRLAPGSRVAVIRLRSLGDSVLCTPALRLLKRARPDLEIAVVSEERFADVFRGNPDVSTVLPPDARALHSFGARLCLNLHGGTRSARLTLLSGARFRAGFDIFRPRCVYNTPIPTAQETLGVARRVHTAEHAASAVFALGVPVSEVPRAFIAAPAGRSAAAPAGEYAVIHPFAATPEKTWPAARFVAVAKSLSVPSVFVGGSGDDVAPFVAWPVLAGEGLPELARLMRDAAFFIGNDSGPAHVAAAFGIPVVVLFGPSDSEVWAPWRTRSVVLKGDGPIGTIPVERVLEGVKEALPV